MFLQAQQLESVVLKRLEHLQGLENVPALGMLHCLTSVLQANISAAGVEWSSTDGSDEGQQDHVQVDTSDDALVAQLNAWQSWLAADGGVSKAQYFSATHALIQEVLNCTIEGSEPTISQVALDAAWQEDTGSLDSAAALPSDRFKSSLAALVTACSADGTPQAAAACLASVLPKLWDGGQPQQRWLDLSERYSGLAAPAAVDVPAEGKADDSGAAAAGSSGAAAAREDSDDDLDALLGEDEGGAPGPAAAVTTAANDAGTAAEPSGRDAGADGEAAQAAEEDDDAFSLGISRAPSTAASELDEGGEDQPSSSSAAEAEGTARRAAAARAISVKSIEDPELRRALSGASSADLDELPPEDLDSAVLRQGTHANASTRAAARHAAGASDGSGKVGLSDLQTDLRSWAAMKDKQREHPPNPGPQAPAKGRAPLAPLGSPIAPPGRGDVGKPAADQHLKGVKNPLHGAIISGSPVRQSMERDRGATGSFVSRRGSNTSNETPARLISNLSRKLSISEPGPIGQHAEWKHLPALGQASRLHPPEMRQPSYGVLRTGPSRSRGDSGATAAALIDDKLPMLPSLAGARGQPPKAMELLRRPSVIQRSDAHHAEGHPGPANPHLPGLGSNPKPKGARALCVQPKKSFRGDSNF